MHTRLTPLSNETLETLGKLRRTVPAPTRATGRLHLGSNGVNRLSVYNVSTWFAWSRQQRQTLKQLLPSAFVDRAINGWFLEFPPEDGFLDRMTQWEGQVTTGSIVAYSLQDGQEFWIDDEPHTFDRGEGVAFPLNSVHEVLPSNDGQQWVCLLTLWTGKEWGQGGT